MRHLPDLMPHSIVPPRLATPHVTPKSVPTDDIASANELNGAKQEIEVRSWPKEFRRWPIVYTEA